MKIVNSEFLENLKNKNNISSKESFSDIEEFDTAKTKVLKYIIYKKRTESEVRNKFKDDIDETLLDKVIDYLKENKYIDDSDYIHKRIKDYTNFSKFSLYEIKYKLVAKGLKDEEIEDYISSNYEELNQYEVNTIKAIITKKRDKDSDAIVRYLYSKGFKSENIKKAIELLED